MFEVSREHVFGEKRRRSSWEGKRWSSGVLIIFYFSAWVLVTQLCLLLILNYKSCTLIVCILFSMCMISQFKTFKKVNLYNVILVF